MRETIVKYYVSHPAAILIGNPFKNNLIRVVIVLDPQSAISPEMAASEEHKSGIPLNITISVEHQY